MGIFSNLKKATLRKDYNFVGIGRYWMRLNKLHEGEGQVDHVPRFEIYSTILKIIPSSDPAVHLVGDEVIRMIKASMYSDSDIASFFVGIGVFPKPEDMEEALVKNAVGPNQPLRGIVFEMNNRATTIKDKDAIAKGDPEAVKDWSRLTYVRQVPNTEVLKELSADMVAKFFPDNFLQKQIAAGRA